MVIGLIMLLGIGLVVAARSSRDPLLAPRTSDHWHLAYTIYDCGEALPLFSSTSDPDGIHSHQDGLIHVHPFNSSATGEDATMAVFLDAMGASITDVAIDAPEFGRIEAADGCDGQPAEIKAARWRAGDDGWELIEEYDSDFDRIRFTDDGEALTFGRVPVGESVPEPSAEATTALRSHSLDEPLQSQGPVNFDDVVGSTSTLAPLGDETPTTEPATGDSTATSTTTTSTTTTTTVAG